MRKHYVVFESPGTFFHESSARPIDSWDVRAAVKLANGITERHGAKPFALHFTTVLCAEPVPDGEGGRLEVQEKKIAESGRHFLGGTLLTLDELRAQDDPDLRILMSNMECNGFPVVVRNDNSWRTYQPFGEKDVVVDGTGNVTARGDDPKWVAYRREKAAEREAELERWTARHKAAR